MSQIISQYKDLSDLTGKIIGLYIKELEMQIRINKRLLKDKCWSNDGSDEHKELRKETSKELINYQSQLNLLKHNL